MQAAVIWGCSDMNKQNKTACCARPPNQKELLLEKAGYDEVENAVLHIARYYWQTFATPQSHSWLSAISLAEHYFGGTAAQKVLSVVQAMTAVPTVTCAACEQPGPAGGDTSPICFSETRQYRNRFPFFSRHQ